MIRCGHVGVVRKASACVHAATLRRAAVPSPADPWGRAACAWGCAIHGVVISVSLSGAFIESTLPVQLVHVVRAAAVLAAGEHRDIRSGRRVATTFLPRLSRVAPCAWCEHIARAGVSPRRHRAGRHLLDADLRVLVRGGVWSRAADPVGGAVRAMGLSVPGVGAVAAIRGGSEHDGGGRGRVDRRACESAHVRASAAV